MRRYASIAYAVVVCLSRPVLYKTLVVWWLHSVCNAIWSILCETALRDPLALVDILWYLPQHNISWPFHQWIGPIKLVRIWWTSVSTGNRVFTARRYASAVTVCLCVSVTPSIVSKRLNWESRKQYHMIARGLEMSVVKDLDEIQTGS